MMALSAPLPEPADERERVLFDHRFVMHQTKRFYDPAVRATGGADMWAGESLIPSVVGVKGSGAAVLEDAMMRIAIGKDVRNGLDAF